MSDERKCIVCGSPLTESRVRFCSRKCQLKEWDKKKREERKRLKAEQIAEKEKKKPKVSFSMILKGMDETDLSYGEYVARYVKEET